MCVCVCVCVRACVCVCLEGEVVCVCECLSLLSQVLSMAAEANRDIVASNVDLLLQCGLATPSSGRVTGQLNLTPTL